jgi:hypothetical protein
MTPKEELARLRDDIERLEARRAAIYRASVEAPANEKVCDDRTARFLGGGPDEQIVQTIRYPIEVHGITFSGEPLQTGPKAGRWVAVRPCAPPDLLAPDGKPINGRTFLGVYLGDLALGTRANFHTSEGILESGFSQHNPAMWVPDLRRVVLGCGSWWRLLERPSDLAEIADADIQSVWYVRALRDLEGGAG